MASLSISSRTVAVASAGGVSRPSRVQLRPRLAQPLVSRVAKASARTVRRSSPGQTGSLVVKAGGYVYRDDGADISQNYDYNLWKKHRSVWRYVRHVTSTAASAVLRQIMLPCSFITGLAAAMCYAYTNYPGVLPMVNLAPFTLTASVVSLLLVFRTNASYERFTDARRQWGAIVNRTRDINRQAAMWWPRYEGEGDVNDRLELFQRWTVALVYSLKVHLRARGDLNKDLGGVLREHELKALLASNHRPLYCMQVMSEGIMAANLPTILQTQMDTNLTSFEDSVGACERILRTPIPLSYTRHTTRLLMAWLLLLPMSLWGVVGWLTVPVTFVISFMMLGLEEIGVSIEEPFTFLALDGICGGIAGSTGEVLRTHSPKNYGKGPISAKEIVEWAHTPALVQREA